MTIAEDVQLIQSFLENVQHQGRTGFNLREREMDAGATEALAALLRVELAIEALTMRETLQRASKNVEPVVQEQRSGERITTDLLHTRLR